MKNIASFQKIFQKAAYCNSYPQVFDDFLTMCICAFSRNMKTGLSHYEDEYLEVIKPYKANNTLDYFPQLLAEMVSIMEKNKDASDGNDILGEFFQQEISNGRNGQFFTPNHVTDMMAKMIISKETEPKRILDPCCGSGRMMLSAARTSKVWHHFYGVDIDPVCVKMSAINMFLNGLRGEVICADALVPDDFRHGYKISFIPLGIFKIEVKENSVLWQMNCNTFTKNIEQPIVSQIEAVPGQLTLF